VPPVAAPSGRVARGGRHDGAAALARAGNASAPLASTGGASGVSGGAAQVSGTVSTNGATTTVAFEYGPTAAYGSTTPVQTVAAGAPASTVSAALAGLAPGTTYHYRIDATNAAGTSDGADATFTSAGGTPVGLAARTRAASAVRARSALLGGLATVPADGATIAFEWGTTRAYGAQTPLRPLSSSAAAQDVHAVLGGLAPGTTYHYRLLVQIPGGAVRGADRSFTTRSLPLTFATGAVSGAGHGRVTLSGRIGPHSGPLRWTFALRAGSGRRLATTVVRLGPSAATSAVRMIVSGLVPGARYAAQLVVHQGGRSYRGAQRGFSAPA
jgi:phosphodiesterase/alkaline phosphatase D-like protein